MSITAAIVVTSIALGAYLALTSGKKSNAREPQPGDLKAQTSTRGQPIPVVYGNAKVAGNLIWYDNFQTVRHEQKQEGGKGGGGSGTSVSYTYTVSFAFALCMGYANVCRVWKGKEEISLCQFRIYRGNQLNADPHIVALTSRNPVYKNLCYIVAEDYDLGDSPYFPQLTFEVSRPVGHFLGGDDSLVAGSGIVDENGTPFGDLSLESGETYQLYADEIIHPIAWSVSGTGASIDQAGLLTTDSSLVPPVVVTAVDACGTVEESTNLCVLPCSPTPSISCSSGPCDEITSSSSKTYYLDNAVGTVTWSVSGAGASIDPDTGVLTTDSSACGGLSVTGTDSCCGSFGQAIRVTNAGYWVTPEFPDCFFTTNYDNSCFNSPDGPTRQLDFHFGATPGEAPCGFSDCGGGGKIGRYYIQHWECIP